MNSVFENRRPRLLLLNYACSPYHGSEPGVGWNRAVQAARFCDTWVIVEGGEFEADIKRFFKDNPPIDGLRFAFVHKSPWQRLLARVPGFYFVSYNLWQRQAYRVAKQLDREVDFDLVHQMTMCGYREPGYGWKLGKPFVWGPVGGTQNFPSGFLRIAGVRGAISETLRSAANWLQLRLSRRVRAAAHAATGFVAANRSIANDFARVHDVHPAVLSDVGVQAVRNQVRVAEGDRPLRLLWSGNLYPFKALPLLLHALAQLNGKIPFELRVLGSGRCLSAWQRLAQHLGVDQHITWTGRLSHAAALDQYEWADAFVFCSLRDTTGSVIVEALAAGLPVVALDHQGAADVVTEECGIKVPVESPAATIDGLSAAIRKLAVDPLLRERLSRGALKRAANYVWSRKGDDMAEVYFRAVGPTRTVTADQETSRHCDKMLVGGGAQ